MSAAVGGSAGGAGQAGASLVAAAQAGAAAPGPGMSNEAKWNDPGSMPWMAVPDNQVAEECKLDKAMLTANDAKFPSGWAVVRYGKLCHDRSSGDRPTEAYSATKTLGGVVPGIASYETRMFSKSSPRTGQLLDTDLANHWLMSQSYNEEALVAHVLAWKRITPTSHGARRLSRTMRQAVFRSTRSRQW